MVHIIRNAVDHGIESLDERKKSGKPALSLVTIEAIETSSVVKIKVKDDGKGLDTEAILNKAIERGFAKANTKLTQSEIHEFIFRPGFSTAEEITDISGRGVGMDVVLDTIKELKGSIEIQSKKNRGTAFTITLPKI